MKNNILNRNFGTYCCLYIIATRFFRQGVAVERKITQPMVGEAQFSGSNIGKFSRKINFTEHVFKDFLAISKFYNCAKMFY